MLKTCSKCNNIKDTSLFYKSKRYKDGLTSSCKECYKQYSIENSKKIKDYQVLYRNTNNDLINEQRKNYRLNNKEIIKLRSKKYYESNKDKIRDYRKQYQSNRIKIDNSFRIRKNIARRILLAIDGKVKSANTMNLIGCDIDFLKTWLNITALANGYKDFDINDYSGYEYNIDHKVPCAAFNLGCSYHQKLCFNWTNMQILTKEKNLLKSDRLG